VQCFLYLRDESRFCEWFPIFEEKQWAWACSNLALQLLGKSHPPVFPTIMSTPFRNGSVFEVFSLALTIVGSFSLFTATSFKVCGLPRRRQCLLELLLHLTSRIQRSTVLPPASHCSFPWGLFTPFKIISSFGIPLMFGSPVQPARRLVFYYSPFFS